MSGGQRGQIPSEVETLGVGKRCSPPSGRAPHPIFVLEVKWNEP